jgi:hypothetical protein
MFGAIGFFGTFESVELHKPDMFGALGVFGTIDAEPEETDPDALTLSRSDITLDDAGITLDMLET